MLVSLVFPIMITNQCRQGPVFSFFFFSLRTQTLSMSAEGRRELWARTYLFTGIERLLQFSYLELLSVTRFHCGVGWLCGHFEMLVLPFICQDQLTNHLPWGAFSDHRAGNEPLPPVCPTVLCACFEYCVFYLLCRLLIVSLTFFFLLECEEGLYY